MICGSNLELICCPVLLPKAAMGSTGMSNRRQSIISRLCRCGHASRGGPQRRLRPASRSKDHAIPLDQPAVRATDASQRWWVLAAVVAAQFMFVVDAFIVNVALPTIAVDLRASAAQIQAVIAVNLIGYATLVIIGGRLGDIYGAKRVFVLGVLGFTLASLWCGSVRPGADNCAPRAGRHGSAHGTAGACHDSRPVL